VCAQVRLHAGVERGTVWTWNAIGKRRGAWALSSDETKGNRGFLLNHAISDVLPRSRYANADPVTGQAAWYDLRVRLSKAAPAHDAHSLAQLTALPLDAVEAR